MTLPTPREREWTVPSDARGRMNGSALRLSRAGIQPGRDPLVVVRMVPLSGMYFGSIRFHNGPHENVKTLVGVSDLPILPDLQQAVSKPLRQEVYGGVPRVSGPLGNVVLNNQVLLRRSREIKLRRRLVNAEIQTS